MSGLRGLKNKLGANSNYFYENVMHFKEDCLS